MSDFEDLSDGWTVWNEEADGRVILTYRPDVFDSAAYPAACLPTIYLSGEPIHRRRPPSAVPGGDADGTWRVALFLEPEVGSPEEKHSSREAAVEAAIDLAARFADGAIDYREWYQLPREAYLDRLDELTGREG